MREIKFRGKRTDNGEWVYGSLIIDYITDKQYIHATGNSVNESDKVGKDGCLYIVSFEVDPATVGQYTGFKDKNGAEIYEGDLLENRADTLTNFDGSIRRKLKEDIVTVYEVIFEVDHWSRKYVSDTRWNERWNNRGVVSKGMNHTDEFYSVTSNVHDNPEMVGE